MMISRIMVSLKRAADSQQRAWSLTDPTVTGPNLQSMKFFKPRGNTDERQHDIPLDTYTESQIAIP